MSPVLEILTSKLSAIIGWVSTAVMAAGLLICSLTLTHTRAELKDAQATAAGYKATLDMQATLAKANADAFDRAMKDIQPVILHDQKVIQTIREAQPGPDLCASAHQLISDTISKEQTP